MLVHELAEARDLPGDERVANRDAELLHPAKTREHRLVAGLGALPLVVEELVGGSRAPGEEHDEPLLELVHGRGGQLERRDVDAAVGVEPEARDSAERRDVLVLLADRPSEDVDLDAACLLGELGGADVLALPRVQGTQEAHGEGARRAQPGPRRDVREADDLDPRTDRMELERRTNDGMGDLARLLDALERGVLEEVVLRERPVDADEDVLVDGRRDHEAGPLREVRREIRSPASEGDAQRRAGDQHGRGP